MPGASTLKPCNFSTSTRSAESTFNSSGCAHRRQFNGSKSSYVGWAEPIELASEPCRAIVLDGSPTGAAAALAPLSPHGKLLDSKIQGSGTGGFLGGSSSSDTWSLSHLE